MSRPSNGPCCAQNEVKTAKAFASVATLKCHKSRWMMLCMELFLMLSMLLACFRESFATTMRDFWVFTPTNVDNEFCWCLRGLSGAPWL